MIKELIAIFNHNLFHRPETKKKQNKTKQKTKKRANKNGRIHVFLACEDYTRNLSC